MSAVAVQWLAVQPLQEHTIGDCNVTRYVQFCVHHAHPFTAMQEFLLFFSKVSSTITNKEFEEMIKEMSG
jgi:hypothetical protein